MKINFSKATDNNESMDVPTTNNEEMVNMTSNTKLIEGNEIVPLEEDDKDVVNQSAADETSVAEQNTEEVIEVTSLSKEVLEQNARAMENSPALKKKEGEIVTGNHKYVNPAIQEMHDYLMSAAHVYTNKLGEYPVLVEGIEWFDKSDRRHRWGRIGAVTIRLPKGYATISEWDQFARNKKGGYGTFVNYDFAAVNQKPVYVVSKDVNGNMMKDDRGNHIMVPATQALDKNDEPLFDEKNQPVLVPAGKDDEVFTQDHGPFDYDQTQKNDRFAPLHKGSGRLTLAIKYREDDYEQGLMVNLPKSAGKERDESGMPKDIYDIFKTSNIRWGKAHSDNNRSAEAAVSAFLRTFESEFTRGNPENYHAMSPACVNCSLANILSAKDGLDDDLEHEKSNRVLQQNDIPTLVAWGSRTPIVHCPVYDKIMDFDGIRAANKADAVDHEQVFDSELGEERYLRKGELFVDGKIIKSTDVRHEATKDAAQDCEHYHGNVYKGATRADSDRARTGNKYLSAYWTDRAEVNRQVVQTSVDGKWVNEFPGKVEEPEAFRVIGLGGVVVYGTDDVMAAADPNFAPEREEVDTLRAELMSKVNQIFYAAFNFGKLSATQANIVLEMAANKPEIANKMISRRWDSACDYLAQTIARINEGEHIKSRPDFAIRFIEGAKPAGEKGKEVSADVLLDETKFREESGMLQSDINKKSLGYKDLTVNPKEAIKFLDEILTEDIVFDVLFGDATYYVKSRSPKDKLIVTGALQAVLQRHVDSFLYDIRREPNSAKALEDFKVSTTVKEYISDALQLEEK
jgi:hypothetical protein